MTENPLEQLRASQRRHPDSIFYKPATGHLVPFPTGHHKQVADDCQLLRFNAFAESVEVVRTSTGSARHVSIEASAGGLGALQRVLARRRDRGQPAFMLKREWDQLTEVQRDALIVVPLPAAEPLEEQLEALRAENEALRARLAQDPR